MENDEKTVDGNVAAEEPVVPPPVEAEAAEAQAAEAGETLAESGGSGKIEIKAKPLSENRFKAFFQKLYRGWLGKWYGFGDKHKKAADLIYMVFFFLAFSMGVTVYQYIVMTFLPYAFAALNNGAWGVPNTPIAAAGGQPYVIFGDAQGLGYFIAFELATFTAQCINFPLQRNITYKSHGNIAWQIMWYFIGWLLISVFTLALWGIINCFFVYWGVHDAITGLLKTFITGGVSMIIFFFIFMIIFPNLEKTAKSLEQKAEKLKAKGVTGEKLDAAEKKAKDARKKADIDTAERAAAKAVSLADAKAVAYESAVQGIEKAREKGDAAAVESAKQYCEKTYLDAVSALEKRDEANKELEEVKAKYAA